jgi:uncharacterized protein YdeI (YjbR/CyaY-like superfamily)
MILGNPIHFRSQAAFRAWLKKHHRSVPSLVVRIARNHAAALGMTYAQALDEALCFGWIDGVRRRLDGDSFTVRFGPRKPRSIWSRVNVRHVERLIDAGRMTEAGLATFQAREESRTGIYSFEQRQTALSRRYQAIFRENRLGWTYFQDEAPWYRRTSSFWVMSAKRPETQQRRLALLIACSRKGQRIPQLSRP